MAKQILGKNNLIILLGGAALALVLLLPRQFSSTCPKGLTFDPVLGGSCPLFVDQDNDGLCDLIQGVAFQQPTEFDFSYFKEFVIFVFLLAMAIFINLKKPKTLPVVRFALLTFSLFYFGFLLRQALCPIATLQMVFVLKDRVVLTFFIFLVFLLPILTTLLFGRIFCNFLCPIGAAQELIFRVPRMFFKIPIFTKIPRVLFHLPYLTLFFTVLGSALLSRAIFCQFDPFGSLLGCNPISWKVAILGLLLLFSLFIFRPFCDFLCPLGGIFKILTKFQILRRNFKEESKK
jgi:NosR/NirI family nitrous oxide reductase transcriptional regulator